jgi:hypothetical protein
MGTNPPPPPPPSLQDSLRFAEALADREIAAIERLHQRSVRYIGYCAGAFGLALGFFAWVGYQNLRDTAITVAKKEVQEEVVRQVQAQLTTKGLTDVVHDEMDAFVKGELRKQLHTEITTGPLHQEILSVASTQSKDLIHSELAPRHFTNAQAARLKTAIADSPELLDYPVVLRSQGFDLEAKEYSAEIQEALFASKIKLGNQNVTPLADPLEGVVIYYDEMLSRNFADSLARAFKSAGVNALVKASAFVGANPTAGEKSTLFVFVGPKPRYTDPSK